MEGAILAGKLAAEVITDRSLGRKTQGVKVVQPDAVARAEEISSGRREAREPVGIRGDSPIAFGGGMVLSGVGKAEVREQDAVQLEGEPEGVEEKVVV